jgi:hypothetical protein
MQYAELHLISVSSSSVEFLVALTLPSSSVVVVEDGIKQRIAPGSSDEQMTAAALILEGRLLEHRVVRRGCLDGTLR